MVITHASQDKITKVINEDFLCDCRMGCLFFGGEGNTYNLAAECNYQYNIDVENVLEMRRLNYKHNFEECEIMKDVFADMRITFDFTDDATDEELSELLDETLSIDDFENVFVRREEWGMDQWVLQQFQGIIAHKLGYDCAEAEDEQGTVYIAYCVDRKLTEIKCN